MKSWYLLYCKRGEQKRACLHLENQGIEHYYPQIEIEKVVRGTRKNVLEPLFPSYIFISLDESSPSFTTIRSTRGVVDFVRRGKEPQTVCIELINELKVLENTENVKAQSVKSGQKVQIKTGALAGLEAIYQEADGEKRSILLVTLINQPVSLQVNNSDVNWNQ